MRVGPNDGIFLFECMKGCCKGSVVDALMVVEGKTLKEAFAEIHQIYGQNTGSVQPRQWRRPEQPVGPEGGDHGFVEDIKYGKVGSPPVLDEQRVEEFITKSHQHLLDNLRADFERRQPFSGVITTRMGTSLVKLRAWIFTVWLVGAPTGSSNKAGLFVPAGMAFHPLR